VRTRRSHDHIPQRKEFWIYLKKCGRNKVTRIYTGKFRWKAKQTYDYTLELIFPPPPLVAAIAVNRLCASSSLVGGSGADGAAVEDKKEEKPPDVAVDDFAVDDSVCADPGN
jgi:hypothetical protein